MDYFARSHDPRHPRPVIVRYRVGQVVQHKIHGYRGVIIGWDPICKVHAYIHMFVYACMYVCIVCIHAYIRIWNVRYLNDCLLYVCMYILRVSIGSCSRKSLHFNVSGISGVFHQVAPHIRIICGIFLLFVCSKLKLPLTYALTFIWTMNSNLMMCSFLTGS